MNAEQIRQKAEKFAINGNTRVSLSLEILFQNTRDAFIAGAHSRDEEIESLQRRVSMWKHEAEVAAKELDQLRNPWISVEERLPDEEGDYLIQVDSFSRATFGFYSVRNNKFLHLPPNVNVTHWMPIPELKKGE